MENKAFEAWCQDATKEIRYPPDREPVRRELMGHLEDHRDAYIAEGISEEAATEQALAAMGGAEEIAPALGKLHRPFWGYFYSATKWIAIILCAVVVYTVLSQFVRTATYIIARENGENEPPYAPMWSSTVIAQDVSAYSDGYLFRVSQSEYGVIQDKKHLRFHLDVINSRLTTCNLPAIRYIWAVDSNGTYYHDDTDHSGGKPCVWINGFDGVGYIGRYYLELYFMPEDQLIEWVELHYDRDGRDVVLRIELPGGVGE